MKKEFRLGALCLTVVLVATSLWAADTPATSAPKEGEAGGKSLTELNKELTNPISSLWSIAFQQNNYMLDMGPGKEDHWNSNLNFRPVLPVALTDEWNLMTRPVMTLFNSVPHPDPHNPFKIDRTTAFGDTVLMELFFPYIWQAAQNGISVLLHYDSYVCIRSLSYFTPQAAGNTTRRDLKTYIDPFRRRYFKYYNA